MHFGGASARCAGSAYDMIRRYVALFQAAQKEGSKRVRNVTLYTLRETNGIETFAWTT